MTTDQVSPAVLHALTDQARAVSNSELKVIRECKRRWWLEYHRKLTRRTTQTGGALYTGTIVHSAMNAYHLAGGSRQAALGHLALLRANATAEYGDFPPKDTQESFSMADSVVTGYFDWLEETGADVNMTVKATEIKLRAPSPVEGVDLLGKIDLIVEEISTGRWMIRDYKTAASLTEPIKSLHMDRQMKLYLLLLRLVHPKLATNEIEWSLMKKSKRTARAKPPFYSRYRIHHNEEELRVFWRQLHGEISILMDMERRLTAGEDHQVVAFPSPTSDCSWKCPFFAACGMLDDPRSDAEGYLEEHFQPHNPMERYEDVGSI